DAVEALAGRDPGRVWTVSAGEGGTPVAFMFPGGGAQQAGMGAELYRCEPAFRVEVDRCAEILRPELGFDLREVLYPAEAGREAAAARIHRADVAHPALFTVEYALARVWMEWGVHPTAVMGHSLGEYAAACVAGVFELESALRLVSARGRLMQSAPEGAMLVVPLPEAEVLPRLGDALSLAAVNGPGLCLVSGPPAAVAALQARLGAEGVDCRKLHFDRASHSAMMDPVLSRFREEVRAARPRAARIPFVSNLTGGWIAPERLADPEYWVSHLRRTVRFADGLTTLLEKPAVLLEVGPGQALSKLARREGRHDANRVGIPSLTAPNEGGSDVQQLLTALGRCWAAGVGVDWPRVSAHERRVRVPLPTYPFERRRFHIEADPASVPATNGPGVSTPAVKEIPTMPLPSPQDPREERVRKTLTGLLGRAFGFPDGEMEAYASASLLELGADSLLLMRISRAVEDEFGVAVPFRRLMSDLSSIDALGAHLHRELPAEPEPPAPAPRFVITEPAHTNGGPPAPAVEAAAVALPAGEGAPQTAVERVIAQQMALMHRQLELLQGGAARSEPTPVTPSVAPPAPEPPPRPNGGPPQPAAREPVREPARQAAEPVRQTAEPEAFGPFQPVRLSGAGGMAPGQQEALDALVRDYVERTRGSRDFAERYRRFLADPRATAGFRMTWKDMVYPIVGERAQGARLWDVDGNEYVDFTMGFGVYLLGHAPPVVADAVRRQLEMGSPVGPQSLQAGRVAELVCQLTGAERVAFCNSGTEAMMAAIRLARAATGRNKIAIFSGAYHGTFDGVLARRRPGSGETIPVTIGTPPGMVEDVLVLEYGAPASLDALRAHAHELAAVLDAGAGGDDVEDDEE
ncbi:MAG: aminotransferase class III-fold pyridoxal phosphate-dependent enzyme, partial [Gemmatimonadetes bacterium]|nr:aminotransferase class III-fold pyridoxal phosphate-dependent enzyme [Gemmatimonadota bacterium]